jgi:hypothetical protein
VDTNISEALIPSIFKIKDGKRKSLYSSDTYSQNGSVMTQTPQSSEKKYITLRMHQYG